MDMTRFIGKYCYLIDMQDKKRPLIMIEKAELEKMLLDLYSIAHSDGKQELVS